MASQPVDPVKFMAWLERLIGGQERPIIRSKGILAFQDEPKRFVFHGVSAVLEGSFDRDWAADEKRESRLVLIGHSLDRNRLMAEFASCAAPGNLALP